MSISHGASLFSFLASSSCCAIWGPQEGLLEVPVIYLGSRGYFLALVEKVRVLGSFGLVKRNALCQRGPSYRGGDLAGYAC
jgi:hypothetical protein